MSPLDSLVKITPWPENSLKNLLLQQFPKVTIWDWSTVEYLRQIRK